MELDPAALAEQRRADRAAKIEIEAGGRGVDGPIDQSRTGDATAADHTGRFDAIDDRARFGAGAKDEGECNRRAERSRAQLYAGSVAGRGLNPSGMTFWIFWRTSSGVIPIAEHPLPP
jgi:hypothetical protein